MKPYKCALRNGILCLDVRIDGNNPRTNHAAFNLRDRLTNVEREGGEVRFYSPDGSVELEFDSEDVAEDLLASIVTGMITGWGSLKAQFQFPAEVSS